MYSFPAFFIWSTLFELVVLE